MFKKKIKFFLFPFLLLFIFVKINQACIGKTITIGYKNFNEQRILAEILYVAIMERTGTTVVLKSFSNTEECYNALQKGDISISIEYAGAAYSDILHKDAISQNERDKIIEIVKDDFSQKKNLVWLNLFGFESIAPENEYLRKKGFPLRVAPVIGKETLKMFPVLPRLLNKIGGKIDDSSIKSLMKSVEEEKINPRTAAQNFLKEKKLI